MSYERHRSQSATEEANVTTFVQSCINFKTNVSFHSIEEGVRLGEAIRQDTTRSCPRTVLLLGSETDFAQGDNGNDNSHTDWRSMCPHYDAATMQHAVEEAPVDSVHVASITPTARLLIGKVSSTASRHNCPARPDCVGQIIEAAMKECPRNREEEGLDVYYVGSSDAICIAAAVARSCNRSFSAKSRNAEKSYLNAGRPVRVMLPARHYDALHHTAMCIQLCQRLVDAPTSLLDTITFTEIALGWVHRLREQYHCDCNADVIAGEELRERGYGGLYGTGKAAEYPPHLVTLSYQPQAGIAPRDRLALVGKGIVYDTGGLAIKPRDGMLTMKHDMGGAAAVFCGFVCLSMMQVPITMSSILCLADNAVGPRSQRNDDILLLRSGVSVEVNNTDAEGRLVLSDGVYHASAELSYTPRIIVDMATLTGAQGMCTGKLHAAIYTNSEEEERHMVSAGRRCGDLCFPVVYCPELHNMEYKSAVADYRNSVANRANAQVSCAGQFIGNNLAKEYKGDWVHVDLAYPATHNEGTGFGVALIVQSFAADMI